MYARRDLNAPKTSLSRAPNTWTGGSYPGAEETRTVCLDACIPVNPKIYVDISSVFWAKQALQTCPIVPICAFPNDIELHPATQTALHTLIEPPLEKIPSACHFCVDGSKLSEGQVGAAVFLLWEFDNGLVFGGYLCHRVPEAQHAQSGRACCDDVVAYLGFAL